LGAKSFYAFMAMLRINMHVEPRVPLITSDTTSLLRQSYNGMLLEMRLNAVGRGRLLESTKSTRERNEWMP
jgi:hypothetical protein